MFVVLLYSTTKRNVITFNYLKIYFKIQERTRIHFGVGDINWNISPQFQVPNRPISGCVAWPRSLQSHEGSLAWPQDEQFCRTLEDKALDLR